MIKSKQKQSPVLTSSSKCPKCASEGFRRTTFRTNEPLMVRLFSNAQTCKNCGYRFFLINKVILVWVSIIAGLLLFMLIAVIQPFGLFQAGQENDIISYNRAKERALNGNSAAELQVGLMLSEGRGVVKNEKEAVEWLKKSAQHGNIEAQYHFGNAEIKGIGVLQNYKDAIYWLEKAARAGYMQAQYDLGNVYRFKSGIENNDKRAYLWLTLAAGQGSLEAASARDQVEGRLKAEEIEALQEEASRIINEYK